MPHKNVLDRKEYQRQYGLKHRERKKHIYQNSHLKRKHGITLEQYNEILKQQNYRCAFCDKHISELERRLAVDHCHETGRIRGLLCMPCNTSLGQLGDTSEAISKVLNYLQNMGV